MRMKAKKAGSPTITVDPNWGQFLELYGIRANELCTIQTSSGVRNIPLVIEGDKLAGDSVNEEARRLATHAHGIIQSVRSAILYQNLQTFSTVQDPTIDEIGRDLAVLFDPLNYRPLDPMKQVIETSRFRRLSDEMYSLVA